jgi:hypothetical protein
MTATHKLRTEADHKRARFFATATALSDQLRPAEILDDVVSRLDPDHRLLTRVETEVKKNPVALLGAVGCVWLFIRQLQGTAPAEKSSTRPVKRQSRLKRALPKGENNGYSNDAKYR